jgi:phospho-2-dehydro-3-deoxyheptonate aldolase
VSLTDACLGWDETERLLREAAAALRASKAPARAGSMAL